jgi:acyl-CoA thioester hydrolase
MARIIIDIPTEFIFHTTLDVRISDINYGQHVGHDTFISMLHESRVRFFSFLGYKKSDIHGKTILISDLAASYLAQAFYGDRLDVDMAVSDMNKYGCDIYYQISKSRDNIIVLRAKTGIVFFDSAKNQISAMPAAFIKTITRLEPL